MAFLAQGDALHEVATDEDPVSVADFFILGLLLLINLANLLILLSPLLLFRLQREKGRLMGNALAISAVAVWLIPWENPEGYLIGYYVWAGSIMLLLQTWRIGWRTFCAMVILGLVTVAVGTYW